MTPHPTEPDAILLEAGAARASVSRRGAELTRWRVGTAELLWTKDPSVWDATAPILFPVVGRAAGGEIRVAGKAYPMGVHGFAAAAAFTAKRLGPAGVRLTLESSDDTLACYPFRFALHVSYRLAARSLSAEIEVENRGDGPMPYACGLHPGLRWPFAGGAPQDYGIEFATAESPFVPEISGEGLFRPALRPVPLEDGRRLALAPELFAAEALCFLGANSASLRFLGPGGAALGLSTSGFDHVALWSRGGAPFLCVESWTGHGDPVGFAGDLLEKPSMRLLPPGGRARHAAAYAYEPPGA
ncbi:aldose 1-epimerase family protein [Methylocella sp.]|uniref:aldose epimerase family protein n=1 Tax=Methylocella sp. TaxID=1978226 RepID=UPI003783D66E